MPKPARARDCTTNWFAYNATLRKLGEMLIWFDKDTTWLAPYEVRAGRPRLFPDSVPILLTRKPHKRRVSKDDGPAAQVGNQILRATRHSGRVLQERGGLLYPKSHRSEDAVLRSFLATGSPQETPADKPPKL